jgi:hypothetical protein
VTTLSHAGREGDEVLRRICDVQSNLLVGAARRDLGEPSIVA